MEPDLEWLDHLESGWTRLEPPPSVTAATFISGDVAGDRIKIRLYRSEDGANLMARVWFGPGAQGPPGHAHGGSIASVLDEVMGSAAWVAGHIALAGELIVRFRSMLPVGTLCIVKAEVATVEGRKVRTRGEVRSREGELFAEGEAIFVTVPPSRLGTLAETSDEWLRDPHEK